MPIHQTLPEPPPHLIRLIQQYKQTVCPTIIMISIQLNSCLYILYTSSVHSAVLAYPESVLGKAESIVVIVIQLMPLQFVDHIGQ